MTTKTSSFQKNNSVIKVLKGAVNKFVRKDPFQPLHQLHNEIEDLGRYFKVKDIYGPGSEEGNKAFYRIFKNIKKRGSTLDLNNEFFIRGIEDSFKEAGFFNELGVGAKSVAQDIGSAWNKIKPGLKGFGQTVKEHPGFMIGKLAPAVAVGGAGLYGAKKLVEHWGRKGAQKELANKQK